MGKEELILCACGCGDEPKPGNKFIKGHNRGGLASFTSNGRWAINYDCCVECGTVELGHIRDGYCRNCYRRQVTAGNLKIKRDLTGGKWARKFDKCVECGTTTVPHKSHGRCNNCVSKKNIREQGKKNRNIGGWSWHQDSCTKCGTTEYPHNARGLCQRCYEGVRREERGVTDLVLCPVCTASVENLPQHIAMMARSCSEHQELYSKVATMVIEYFSTGYTSSEVANIFSIPKRRVLKLWHENFSDKDIRTRGERIRVSKISGEKHYLFGTVPIIPHASVTRFVDRKNRLFFLRSSWEVKYAEFLDRCSIDWEYEAYKFKYYDKEGNPHYYFPDFYLPYTDEFVEVKGYMFEKDQYKIEECIRLHGIKVRLMRKEDFRAIGIIVY